jgi:hypothetical protein
MKSRENAEDGKLQSSRSFRDALFRLLHCLSKHEVFGLLLKSSKFGEAGTNSVFTALDLKAMLR